MSRRSSKLLAGTLLLVSLLPLLWTAFNKVRGDVGHYHDWGTAILSGQVPYRDFPFQYPPYALAWFLLPAKAASEPSFRTFFCLEMLAVDVLAKVLLLIEGFRWLKGWRAYVPFAVFALAGLCQEYIYLKRFDLVPAAMVLVAVSLLSRGKSWWAGLLIALGIGTKLYPALVVPMFLVVAWRRQQLERLILGLACGFVPLALLSLSMPWWNFATLHEERGLQVESLYAGFLWLAHYGGANVGWWLAHASYEVSGPLVDSALSLAKALLVGTVVISVAVSAWHAWRSAPNRPGALARLALLPILAFVAFNFVLSPQYLIWLVGLAALAITDRWSWPLAGVLLGCALSPVIFPSPTYRRGLDLGRTVVLCVRNLALVAAWVGLAVEVWRRADRRGVSAERA